MIRANTASPTRLALPVLAVLALAACSEPAETTYEAGVTDESGGELIVTEETPAVDVEVPETAMTPVPPGETPISAPDPVVTTPVETPVE